MKRLVLAGAALCCACFAQARVDLEYHAAPPKDNKVPEEYQKKRDALRHKVWNVDNLTLANEQAIAREQQREAAESAKRQQHHLEQQQKSSAACGDTRKILTARRSVTCTTSSFQRPALAAPGVVYAGRQCSFSMAIASGFS